MRLTIIFGFIVLFIVACKKEKQQQNHLTGVFVSKELKISTAVKIYTRKGAVTDQPTIDRYLNELLKDGYFFRNLETITRGGTDSMKFVSADTAFIRPFGKWEKRIIKNRDSYTYLYMVDTIRLLVNPYSNPFDEVDQQIGIFKPYYKLTCAGSSNACFLDHHGAQIVQWQSGKLVVPLMSYSLRHIEPGGSQYAVTRSFANNIFDPAVIALLKDRDTLATQAFELVFDKVD